MPRGYRRLRVQGCGAGAAERLRGVLGAFDRDGGGPRRVGEVRQVFDRSAYLAFDAGALGDQSCPGPPLVLLAGDRFDGPLAVRLADPDPGGFTPDGLATGESCRLRSATSRRGPGRYVLLVGDALELELGRDALEGDGTAPAAVRALSTVTPGDAVASRANATLDLLEERDATDGLGWLEELRGLAEGERPSGDLRDLVDWWVAVLDGTGSPTEPPAAVLGRGPGATPSGDDVVGGLLLALDLTTEGERRRRVRAAGEAFVGAAERRTTEVSAALLAQAARGRAAGRLEAAVAGLFAPEVGAGDWPATVGAAIDVGHTSGVDHLVGALLVPLAVVPALAADR